MDQQWADEEGKPNQKSQRVANEQGESEESAWKGDGAERVKRVGQREGREDRVGEVRRLEKRVVREQVALDGG